MAKKKCPSGLPEVLQKSEAGDEIVSWCDYKAAREKEYWFIRIMNTPDNVSGRDGV